MYPSSRPARHESIKQQAPKLVALSYEHVKDLWEHATLLLDNFRYSQAIKSFRRLLRQCSRTPTVNALLWANIGIVHAHLGDYHIAHQTISRAAKMEPSCSVLWYYLGCVSWELQEYRQAKLYFEACESTIDKGIENIDYRDVGFHGDPNLFPDYEFVLNRTELRWNGQQCFFWWQHKKHGAPLPYGRPYGINWVPGGHTFRVNFQTNP